MKFLNDIKFPDFKLPKIKIKNKIDLEKLNIDINNLKKVKKKSKVYDVQKYDTIKDIFLENTKKYRDNVFVLESFNGKNKFDKITYNKFRSDVISFGTGIKDMLGIKGEKIVIIGGNTYEWYVSYMTILCSDNIAVPLDKELSKEEIVNLVKRCNPKAIIFNSKLSEKMESIKDEVDVSYYIEMYKDYELEDKKVGFDYIKSVGNQMLKTGNNTYENIKIDKNEFKVLLFTSGTTSTPKGVMLSNYNLTNNLYSVYSYVNIYEDDMFFSVLPLHHTYESTIGFLVPFSSGSSIAVCRGLKYIAEDLGITKPTILLAVPALAEKLYNKINLSIKKKNKESLINSMVHITNALKTVNFDIKRKVFGDIHKGIGGNLRLLVSAAAPIDKKVGEWYQDIGITFLQGYGLTETAPIAALTPDYKPKVGSVGLPVICANIKINNKDENGIGEVLIKSDTLMLGYYKDKKKTDKVIKDGYFYSGDIGYLDEEGFLYITGRSKNVIIASNGKNVYPEELELMVNKIGYVKESIVYGKTKDNKLEIAVKVTLDEEYIKANCKKDISKKELEELIWAEIKQLNLSLVTHKKIKNLKVLDKDFVKTTTMKIQRHKN